MASFSSRPVRWENDGFNGPRRLHAFVDESGEEGRVDDKLAPFGIEGRRRLGFHRLVAGSTLTFERCHVLPDTNHHVPKAAKFRAVADWVSMARNDDRLVRGDRQVRFACRNHSVDAATRRVVYERVYPVPEGIADMKDVRLGEQH